MFVWHFLDHFYICKKNICYVLLTKFTLEILCHRTTHETESKDSLKNSSSAEQQSYSNPIREEYDLKSAKFSETSEEKRAKLREIEVYLNSY